MHQQHINNPNVRKTQSQSEAEEFKVKCSASAARRKAVTSKESYQIMLQMRSREVKRQGLWFSDKGMAFHQIRKLFGQFELHKSSDEWTENASASSCPDDQHLFKKSIHVRPVQTISSQTLLLSDPVQYFLSFGMPNSPHILRPQPLQLEEMMPQSRIFVDPRL